MKLNALKRSRSRRPIYSASVPDEDGNEHYELAITGPQKHIETIFEKVDFEIEIAPRVTAEQFPERSRSFWNRHVKGYPEAPIPVDKVSAMLGKKHQPPPLPKESVVVTLQRTEGSGTFYALWLPYLYLPTGITGLHFFFPRVWTTWSGSLRYSGNPNLFLNAFLPPPAPPVSSAILAAPIAEGVSFTTNPLPWNHFPAWHRVVAAPPGAAQTHYMVAAHSVQFF